MIDYVNPFEYEAAVKLTPEDIVEYYIEDFNYSRFVGSRRNIFLVGERGTGKTMTLRYNSLPVQLEKSRKKGEDLSLEVVGIYVPNNTPLTYNPNVLLQDELQASVLSIHFLVVSLMYAFADTIAGIPGVMKDADGEALRKELEFTCALEFPPSMTLFDGIKAAVQRELTLAERSISAKQMDSSCESRRTFSSGVMPMIKCFQKLPQLANTHFSFMIDDAHALNPQQVVALNSWIAYRDHSQFSFKVATAKVEHPSLHTTSGGAILEGHDFTLVDMEQPYQNQYSDFGKLARQILDRRLIRINRHNPTADEFFPVNAELKLELEKADQTAKKEMLTANPNATPKQIADHVYKYGRAIYFRGRSRRANRPPYSGLELLVHLSTGVIRNLLQPCYWMYDRVVSEKRASNEELSTIRFIPPPIQTEVILDRSKRKWEWLASDLDRSVEGCSREQAIQVWQLFDQLAILFTKRLLRHKSEPRAIAFTISDHAYEHYSKLIKLLQIGRRGQILYEYTSSAKDSGRRETYYVPNRILWPARGLDPQGQNARVSLKARHLWMAAVQNKPIPFVADDKDQTGGLFDDK